MIVEPPPLRVSSCLPFLFSLTLLFAVLAVLGNLSFMPVLVLAARICPPGVEATLFATLMSIINR